MVMSNDYNDDLYERQIRYKQQVRFCLSSIIDIIHENDLIYDEKYVKDAENETIYSFINRSILSDKYLIGIITDAFDLTINTLLPRMYTNIMIHAYYIQDGNKITCYFNKL